mmetsp:Transcript_17754/g.43969  ORF Transcript_17754/g.43969 Transcript_17754/m.43969 type:complete len:352 (+) Transcript_17754:2202-3257(+)
MSLVFTADRKRLYETEIRCGLWGLPSLKSCAANKIRKPLTARVNRRTGWSVARMNVVKLDGFSALPPLFFPSASSSLMDGGRAPVACASSVAGELAGVGTSTPTTSSSPPLFLLGAAVSSPPAPDSDTVAASALVPASAVSDSAAAADPDAAGAAASSLLAPATTPPARRCEVCPCNCGRSPARDRPRLRPSPRPRPRPRPGSFAWTSALPSVTPPSVLTDQTMPRRRLQSYLELCRRVHDTHTNVRVEKALAPPTWRGAAARSLAGRAPFAPALPRNDGAAVARPALNVGACISSPPLSLPRHERRQPGCLCKVAFSFCFSMERQILFRSNPFLQISVSQPTPLFPKSSP